MTDLTIIGDFDELDVYDATDPLPVRLELLERIAARARIDADQRVPAIELFERVIDEIDELLTRAITLRASIGGPFDGQ